ncbi:MAG: hypothetical protein IM583_21300 [Pseudanabaena sp. M114S2SP2A07QC]|nr:hypothetical protein [Pseudanabaena sp. M114S2SP2A07QC]
MFSCRYSPSRTRERS